MPYSTKRVKKKYNNVSWTWSIILHFTFAAQPCKTTVQVHEHIFMLDCSKRKVKQCESQAWQTMFYTSFHCTTKTEGASPWVYIFRPYWSKRAKLPKSMPYEDLANIIFCMCCYCTTSSVHTMSLHTYTFTPYCSKGVKCKSRRF